MAKGYYYFTILGTIGIAEEKGSIVEISYDKIHRDFQQEKTKLIEETFFQLNAYINGNRKTFQIPLHFCGTTFQKKVWEALLEIPYGETKSYQEIAEKIGNPKALRAVGNAIHGNPIAIVVPCHRVIGKNHKLVGYAGGIHRKEILLNLEKKNQNKTKDTRCFQNIEST